MRPQILWEDYKKEAARYLCGPSYESSKLKLPKKKPRRRKRFACDKDDRWLQAKKKRKVNTKAVGKVKTESTYSSDNDEDLLSTHTERLLGPITVEIVNLPNGIYSNAFAHNDTIAEVQQSVASISKLAANNLELRYSGKQLPSKMQLKSIATENPIKLYLNARKLTGQENVKNSAQHLSVDVQDNGRNPVLEIKEDNSQISVIVNTSKLSSTAFKRVELKNTWTFQLQPAKNSSNMWVLSSKDGRGQALLLNLRQTDNGLETLVVKGKLPHMHLSLRADDIKITGPLHLGGELNLISKSIRIDNALSSPFILVCICEKCTVGTEGLLDTSFINIDAKTCIIDGAIFNNRFGKRFLSIITSGDLRTGIHAIVGYKLDAKESVKTRGKRNDPFSEEKLNIGLHKKRKASFTVKSIFLAIKGNFTHFGTIKIGTNGYIECESLKSTSECTEDTARNGYKAHKMIKRLPEYDNQQSITKDLMTAVRETKVPDIPTLIEAGHNQTCVTKAKAVANDIFSSKVLKKNKAQTPIDILEKHKHNTAADLEYFEQVATVAGCLNWWHFKRGHIYGGKLILRVKKDIEDLSQIHVDSLSLHIDGDIYVQKNTHWVSGKVKGIVGGNLFTFGTMKLSYIDNLVIGKDWLVENNVSISHGGCIRCDGALTNNSCINVENNRCEFKVGSFSQAEHAKLLGDVAKKVAVLISISKDCSHILGEWNSNSIELEVSAYVMLDVNIKSDSCLSMYIIEKRGTCLEMLGSVEVLNGPMKGYCIATSNIQAMSQELVCKNNANIILKGHLQSCGIIAPGVKLLIQDKGLVQQNKCLCVAKCASIWFGAITSECETEIIINDCDFGIGVDGIWHHRGTVTLSSDSCFNTTSIFGNTIINDGIWKNLGVLKVTAASKFQNNSPLRTDGNIVMQGNRLIENNAQIATSGSMFIDMFHAEGGLGSATKQVEFVLKLEFHNNSPLKAKGNIVLQGVDLLQNNALLLTYGDMKINKCQNKECINQCEIQNNNGLIAHHGLELIADNIVNHENTGLIMSLLKSVYLRLDSTDEIVLEGLLNTLIGLKIDVPKSGSFTFKCRGGYVIRDQRVIPVGGFALPKLGMNVNCFQGNIHCQKHLIACEPETQLSILAQHLLEFSQNVHVPEVHIHLPSKIKRNSNMFVLRFDGASLVTNEICITTESNTVDLKVETPKLGKINCSNMVEASSVNLMLEGTFEGEPDCGIVAGDLLILKGSEIKFKASQNRAGIDCTAQVDVQYNFSSDGHIESEHEISISSRGGYIAMHKHSKTSAQKLTLKTCKKTIKSYGNVQVRGDLVFLDTDVSTFALSSATYCVNLIAAALNSDEEATDGALVIPYGCVQIYGRLTLHTSSQVLSHELIVAESGSIELLPLPVESQREAKRNHQAVFNVKGKFCTGGNIRSREIFTMTINSEQGDIIMKQTSRVNVHQLVARCSPKQQVLFDGEMHIDASLCILDSNSIEFADSNSMQCANIEVRYENLSKDLLRQKIMTMKGSAEILENIVATECDVLLWGNTEILTTSVISCKSFTLQNTGCLVLSQMRLGNSAQLQSCHGHFDDGNTNEAEVTDTNLQLAKINVQGRFCTEGKITSGEVFTLLIDSEEDDIIMKQTSRVNVHQLAARCSPKQQVLFDGEMHIDASLCILDSNSIEFTESNSMQCANIEVRYENLSKDLLRQKIMAMKGSAKVLENIVAPECDVLLSGNTEILTNSMISCKSFTLQITGCLVLSQMRFGNSAQLLSCHGHFDDGNAKEAEVTDANLQLAKINVKGRFCTEGKISSSEVFTMLIDSEEDDIVMKQTSCVHVHQLAARCSPKQQVLFDGEMHIDASLCILDSNSIEFAESNSMQCANIEVGFDNAEISAVGPRKITINGSAKILKNIAASEWEVLIEGKLSLSLESQMACKALTLTEVGSILFLPKNELENPSKDMSGGKNSMHQAFILVQGLCCAGGSIKAKTKLTLTIESQENDIKMEQSCCVQVYELVVKCPSYRKILFAGKVDITKNLYIQDAGQINQSNSLQCVSLHVGHSSNSRNIELLKESSLQISGKVKILEKLIAPNNKVVLFGTMTISARSELLCGSISIENTGSVVCEAKDANTNVFESEQKSTIEVKGLFRTKGRLTSGEKLTLIIHSQSDDIIFESTSNVQVHQLVTRCPAPKRIALAGNVLVRTNFVILDSQSITIDTETVVKVTHFDLSSKSERSATDVFKQGNLTIAGNMEISNSMKADNYAVKIDGHLFISDKSNISCYALSITEIGCLTLQPQEMGSDSSYPRCNLMVNDDFSNWGKLVSCEKSNTIFLIHTKHGKVNFWETSSTSLSNLCIFSRTNISIDGELQIKDKFQATNACQLHIGRSSKLTCENFSVPPLSSKNEAEIVLQNFEIMGQLHAKRVEVTVAGFKLVDGGHLLIDGDNRSYIIVQEGGMTLSGNIDNKGNVDSKSEPTQNGFFLKAKRCIECIGMTAFLNNKGMRLSSDEQITLDEQCRIELSSSFLIIDTSTKTDCDVNISGEILGSFIYKAKESLDTETRDVAQYNPDDPRQLPWFEVTGHNVTFKKLKLAKIAHTQIKAEYKFILDELSEICKQNTMYLEAEVLLLHGKIQSVVEILTIEPWNFHVTGSIEDIGILKIFAELFALNNGIMSASRIEIFSPVLMNIWQPKGNDRVKALIESTCLLLIEGLVCLYVGSIKHAKSHQIRAVLSFEFDGEITTKRPSTDQLNQWKSAIDRGLRPAAELQSKHDEFGSFINDSIKKLPQMACSLSATNHLCTRVMALSENLKSNGVHTFNLNELCVAFETAHTTYHRISSFETFRINLRKLKGRAKCCLKDIFGKDCLLDIKQTELDSVVEEGIEAITFMSYSDSNSNVSTGGNYVADARVWINKGNIVAGMDLSVRSDSIVHGDISGRRQLRALRAITLSATNDIRANNLCSSVLSVTAAGDIELSSTKTDKFQVQTKGNARVEDLDTKTAQIDANNVNLLNGTIAENAEITANNDVSVGNIKVAGKITLEAKQGKASMVDKVKAKTVELIGGQDGATIVGKNGANHEIETLKVRNAKWSNEDLKLILSAKGAYESLQIKDKLDLCIPDQNVLLANMEANISYGLDIEAKTLNLQSAKINSDRSVRLKTTELQIIEKSDVHGTNVDISSDGSINVDSSNITSSGNTKLEAGKDISIKAGSHKSTIKGDTSVTIKAERNIDIESSIIESLGDNTLSAGGNLTLKEKHKEFCTVRKRSRFFGLKTEEKKVYHTEVMPTEIISFGGKNMISAGGNISSVATKFGSALGNVVEAQGHVDMRNYVANTRTETNTRFLGGLLGGRKQTAEHETNYETMLRDKSENAKTTVMSRTKDVTFHGSGIKSAGKVSIASDKGNIVFTEQKLNEKSTSDEVGIDPSKVLGGNLQLTARKSNEMSQSISNTGLQAKCLDISAGNALIVKEGFEIDVANNMSCNVRNINIEGATCMSSAKSHDVSFSVDPFGTALRYEYAMTASKATKNSRIKVGGAFDMGNIEKLTIKGGNVETNEIRGRFDQMHVESIQDEMRSRQLGMEVGRGFNGTITPSLDMHVVDSKQVKCTSGINVKKGGTENLQGKNLYMKGAMLKFNGEVSDFVENVDEEKIKDAHIELNVGISCNITNPKKLAVQRSMAKFGLDLNEVENVSTITSRKGIVDKKMSRKINTDEASAKKSIMSCKIDTITIQTPSIKTTVVKISTEAGMKVAKELGIDSDVIDLISLLVDHKGKGQDIVIRIVKIIGKNLRFEAEIINVFVVIVEGVLTKTLSADSVIDLLAVLAKQFGIQIKIVSSLANTAKALSGHGNPRAAIFRCLQDLAISAGIEKRIVEAFVTMVDELEKGNDGAQSIVTLVIQVVKHAGIVKDRELLCQFEKLNHIVFSPRNVTPTLIEVGCYIASKMDIDSNVVTTVSTAIVTATRNEDHFTAACYILCTFAKKVGMDCDIVDIFNMSMAAAVSKMDMTQAAFDIVKIVSKRAGYDYQIIELLAQTMTDISNGKDLTKNTVQLAKQFAVHAGFDEDLLMLVSKLFDGKRENAMNIAVYFAGKAGLDEDIAHKCVSLVNHMSSESTRQVAVLDLFKIIIGKSGLQTDVAKVATTIVDSLMTGERREEAMLGAISSCATLLELNPHATTALVSTTKAVLFDGDRFQPLLDIACLFASMLGIKQTMFNKLVVITFSDYTSDSTLTRVHKFVSAFASEVGFCQVSSEALKLLISALFDGEGISEAMLNLMCVLAEKGGIDSMLTSNIARAIKSLIAGEGIENECMDVLRAFFEFLGYEKDLVTVLILCLECSLHHEDMTKPLYELSLWGCRGNKKQQTLLKEVMKCVSDIRLGIDPLECFVKRVPQWASLVGYDRQFTYILSHLLKNCESEQADEQSFLEIMIWLLKKSNMGITLVNRLTLLLSKSEARTADSKDIVCFIRTLATETCLDVNLQHELTNTINKLLLEHDIKDTLHCLTSITTQMKTLNKKWKDIDIVTETETEVNHDKIVISIVNWLASNAGLNEGTIQGLSWLTQNILKSTLSKKTMLEVIQLMAKDNPSVEVPVKLIVRVIEAKKQDKCILKISTDILTALALELNMDAVLVNTLSAMASSVLLKDFDAANATRCMENLLSIIGLEKRVVSSVVEILGSEDKIDAVSKTMTTLAVQCGVGKEVAGAVCQTITAFTHGADTREIAIKTCYLLLKESFGRLLDIDEQALATVFSSSDPVGIIRGIVGIFAQKLGFNVKISQVLVDTIHATAINGNSFELAIDFITVLMKEINFPEPITSEMSTALSNWWFGVEMKLSVETLFRSVCQVCIKDSQVQHIFDKLFVWVLSSNRKNQVEPVIVAVTEHVSQRMNIGPDVLEVFKSATHSILTGESVLEITSNFIEIFANKIGMKRHVSKALTASVNMICSGKGNFHNSMMPLLSSLAEVDAGIMDSVAILTDNKSTVEMKISAAIIATAHLLQKLRFGPEITDVLVSTAAIMKSSENRAKELINLVRLHLRFVKGDNEVISFVCEILPVISSGEDWHTVALNLITIVAETIGIENMFIARTFDTLKKVLVEDDKIKCIVEFLSFLAQEAGIDADITNIICSFFDGTNDGEKLCLGVFQAVGRKLDINSECLFIITSLVRDIQQGESKNKVVANLIKRLSKHYCLRPELAEIVELVVQALLGEESLEQTMLSMVRVTTRTLCPGSFIGEAITSFMSDIRLGCGQEQSIIHLASKIAENAGIDKRVIDILVENASALLECGNKFEIAKHISSSLAMFANIDPSITSCIVSFAIASAQGKQTTDEVICFLKTISNKIGIDSDLATALAKLTHSPELPAIYDLLCILTKNMTMNSKIKDALVGIIHAFLSHEDTSHEVENLVSVTLQLCKFDIKDTTEVTAAIVSLLSSQDSLSEVALDFELIAKSTADSDLQNLLVLLKCATYKNDKKTWIATQILQIIGGKAGFEECCIETIATTLSLLMSSKDKMKTASEVVVLFASNHIPNSQVVNVITVVLKAVAQWWTNPNAKIEIICDLALNIGVTKDLVEAVSCLLQSKTLDKNAFAHILEILLTKASMSEKHVKTISSAVLSIASSNSFSDCLQRLVPSLCELLCYDPMVTRVIESVMDQVIQGKPVMETATQVADVILTKAGISEENINTFNRALLMLQNTDKKLPAIKNLISMLIKTNCEGLHTESIIEVIIRESVAGKDWKQVIIIASAKMMRILELGEDVEREITLALSLYETDKTHCILGFLSMLAKRINIQPEVIRSVTSAISCVLAGKNTMWDILNFGAEIAETVGVNPTALGLLRKTIQNIQSGENKIKMLRNFVLSVFMQIGMSECDLVVFSTLFDSVLNGELNAEAVINVVELFAKKLFQDSKPMKHAFVLLRSIALKQGISSILASLVDIIAALAEEIDIDKCIIEVCSSMAKCFICGGDKRQAVMKTVTVFAEKIKIDPKPVLAVASFIDSVRAGHNMKKAATELLLTICKHINISEDISEFAINMLIVVLNGGTVTEAVIEMVTTLAKRIGIDSNLVDNIVETFQSLQTGNDQVETSLELMALFARKAGLDADIVDAMVVLIKAIANKQGVDEAASDLHLLLVDKLK